jgi:hypothetical protein
MSFRRVKETFLLVVSALVLLTACSQKADPTPQATQTAPPPPLDVTYCDIDPADICLEGFGLDLEERLLVLFKVSDQDYSHIYIHADGPDGEIFFECQQSEEFPEDVYCLGAPFPDEELIKLNIYSKSSNKLVAIGVFKVQYGDLPEPDITFEADATPTPSPEPSSTGTSYPNPTAYPNPPAP